MNKSNSLILKTLLFFSTGIAAYTLSTPVRRAQAAYGFQGGDFIYTVPLFDVRKTYSPENAIGITARSTLSCQFPTATPTNLYQNLDIGWRTNNSTAAQNQPMGPLSANEQNLVSNSMHIVSVDPNRQIMTIEVNALNSFHTDLPNYNLIVTLVPTGDSQRPCIARAVMKLGPSSGNKEILVTTANVEIKKVFFIPTGINNITIGGFDSNNQPVSARYNYK